MGSKFPATSIGRTMGRQLSSPSPSPSPAASEDASHPLLGSGTAGGTAYVPYTPRQRPTTGTTLSSAGKTDPQNDENQTGESPGNDGSGGTSSGHGGAVDKLQVMHVKAALQGVGADGGSVGWAIIERLMHVGRADDEWADVWAVIADNKATLLLPTDPHDSKGNAVTPEFVKDHIVLCDAASMKNGTPVVTLSGLRGTLLVSGSADKDTGGEIEANSATIQFQSSLHHSSPHFQSLLDNPNGLSGLPPLSLPGSGATFPSYALPSLSTPLSLSLPTTASSQSSSATSTRKPPLPPRPAPPPSSRMLSNPFASIFSKATTATKSHSPSHSPAPSISSAEMDNGSMTGVSTTTVPVSVSALAVDKRVIFDDVAAGVVGALQSQYHFQPSASGDVTAPAPPWVVDKLDAFGASFMPFVELTTKNKDKKGRNRNKNRWAVQDVEYLADVLGEMVQDFYAGIEEEVDERVRASKERSDVDGGKEAVEGTEKDGEDDHDYGYGKVMAAVERGICVAFYDRLFRPPESTDAQHDEALASRIAALNVLDLTLAHLDLVFDPDANDAVNDVVRQCGECLGRLQSVWTASAKAAVLVECHKVIVDGLADLPQIRLRKEGEVIGQGGNTNTEDTETPAASTMETSVSTDTAASTETAVSTPRRANTPAEQVIADAMMTSEPEASSPSSPAPSPPVPDQNQEVKPGEASKKTEVSLDVLFPLLIFAVVRANPAQLVSHILFTQRFLPPGDGDNGGGGEARYCLVNVLAVVEFLENVDMGTLGLGMGTSGVALPLVNITSSSPSPPRSRAASISSTAALRDQVDALAGSANKVLSGSFGMLRSFLPDASTDPRLGMLRRDSVFSIKSILPGGKSEAGGDGEELRPVSRATTRGDDGDGTTDGSDEDGSSDEEEGEGNPEEEGEEEESGEDDEEGYESQGRGRDTRSIRSFESMMKDGKGKKGKGKGKGGRPSLSDRLSGIAGRPRPALPRMHSPSPSSPQRTAKPKAPLPPPVKRFMECAADGSDLRIGDVGELLREYRRLVDVVHGS